MSTSKVEANNDGIVHDAMDDGVVYEARMMELYEATEAHARPMHTSSFNHNQGSVM